MKDSANAPPTSDDIDHEEKQSEEVAQLAMKAAEAFLGSQDHNDIEGSQYQLVCKTLYSMYIYMYNVIYLSCEILKS